MQGEKQYQSDWRKGEDMRVFLEEKRRDLYMW
jgi:hypothetical protein